MNCTLNDILTVVGREYHLTPQQLMEKTRRHPISHPRQIVMWIARDITKLSLPDIGTRLGGWDHTTVMYGVKKIGQQMCEDPAFGDKVRKLEAACLSRAAERMRAQGRGVPTVGYSVPA